MLDPGKLLGHLLGIALGCCELGAGSANLASQGAIAVNLATLGLELLDALFRLGEVFGRGSALAADCFEGGGQFVDRPDQDLKFERVHCSSAPLMRL
ncbi:hypothetical protein D3C86_1538830 [compost metagenome]